MWIPQARNGPSFPCALLVCTLLGDAIPFHEPAHGQCEYDVTAIAGPACPPFGTPYTQGYAINDQNVVVGWYEICISGNYVPFMWTQDDGLVSLGLPPGLSSAVASSMNQYGTVTVSTVTRSFIWCDGVYTEMLPEPGENPKLFANVINDDGTIVGARTLLGGDGNYQAFIWSEERGYLDLGFMDGPRSSAVAISESGEFVGGWTGGLASGQCFLWTGGEIHLLGSVRGKSISYINAMNNFGHIAGGVRVDKGPPRAAVWRAGEWWLPSIPNGTVTSTALGINDFGQVVGKIEVEGDSGVLWQGGARYDLNELVPAGAPHLTSGFRINNNGHIIANGTDSLTYYLTPAVFPVGDIDVDCQVSFADLVELLSEWGTGASQADLDGDGEVGFMDLLVLIAHWG